MFAGAIFGLCAVLVDGVSLLVTCLVAAGCCAGMAVVAAKTGQDTAVRTRRASTEKKASPGRKPSARKAPSKPGAKPSKPRKCSVRCRQSTRPASTCDCSCKGRSHGSGITREGLKSVDMQLQERSAVRKQRATAKPKRVAS